MKLKALALALFAAFAITLSACNEEDVTPGYDNGNSDIPLLDDR